MPILKIDEIAPDGVKVTIDWDKFVVGSSMFIPCIDNEKCVVQVRKICELKGFKVTHKSVIYGEKLGVRIWRTV